jgi:hypothetical protein
LPFGGYRGEVAYTLEIDGDPAPIRMQMTGDVTTPGANAIATASVHSLLDAVGPLCDAKRVVVIDDAVPHYCLLQELPA